MDGWTTKNSLQGLFLTDVYKTVKAATAQETRAFLANLN